MDLDDISFIAQQKELNTEWDDSNYNDIVTIEFSLQNQENTKYCLYHNIRKIKDINLDNYQVIGNWCKKKINDIEVTWNYNNGAILHIETESDNYETKRGVKVGDKLEKVMDLYECDSDITCWDYENNSVKIEDDKEHNIFILFYANEGISLNAGNVLDEEMMTIVFYANEGIINKIEIK